MSEERAMYGNSEQLQPSLRLKVKKLHPAAQLPTYGSAGAAGMDVYATESAVVPAGGYAHIGTGLAFELPAGHVMLVNGRSGHGFKHRVRLMNAQGVLDEDFRGELKVGLANDSDKEFEVQAGDRVAQIIVLPFPRVVLDEVQELSDTERGEGGFGSTGA